MKTFKFFSIVALLGILSSCNKDTQPSDIPDGKASVPTAVMLSVNLNGGGVGRSLNDQSEPGTPDENKVNMIEFYVFDAAGAVDPQVGGGTGYIKFEDDQLSRQLIVGSGTDRQFVAVINMELGALDAGDGYTQLREKLNKAKFLAPPAGSTHNSRAIPPTGLEMSGYAKTDIDPDVTTNSVSIDIMRLASKVNAPTFGNTGGLPVKMNLSDSHIKALWGASTTITNDDLTFNQLAYVVVNGLDLSSVLFTGREDRNDTKPKTIPWGDGSFDNKTHLPSAFDVSGNYTNNYSGYGSNTGDWFLDFNTAGQKYVYVYENKPGTITFNGQTGFNPQDVYCFIIKGELIVDGNSALNKTRYWRLDLVHDDNYHVMRNASYHINVKGISSPGQATPEDAEKDPDIIPDNQTSIQIDLDIKDWRINEYNTDI